MAILSSITGLIKKVENTINPNSIDDFKSTISKRNGLAVANRFLIMVQPPSQTLLNFNVGALVKKALFGQKINASDFINDPRDIAMLCESCSLPGRQIQTIDYSSYRQAVKVPTYYANEDITMTFHLTNDYYIRKVFDKWHALVLNPESYLLGYNKEFCADIIIQQLDQNNLPVYAVKLKNAYPVGINSVTLDNTASDTTQRLVVQITYEDFEQQGAIGSTVSGVKNFIQGSLRKLI
jgi:hypothetical protein